MVSASHLVGSLSACLASQTATARGRLRALKLAAGLRWNKEAVEAAHPRLAFESMVKLAKVC